MSDSPHTIRVVNSHGPLGSLPAWDASHPPATVDVTLDDGRRLVTPTAALRRQADGTYLLPTETSAAALGTMEKLVIPLAVEQVDVSKRVVETGRVRVVKTVRTDEQTIDLPIVRQEVTVERVPIERFVDAVPPVRQEGDVTIIPVLEEVLVVEKRLMLKEEVRLTMHRTESHEPQTVALRVEEARVERVSADGSARID